MFLSSFQARYFECVVSVFFLLLVRSAYPWGGEHNVISKVAIGTLAPEDREYIRSESVAIEENYCEFPDKNWPCFGEWGNGTGDPKGARMPDFRRLWGVSYYCQWDPVIKKGTAYNHKPPQSWQAVEVHFRNAVDAFSKGKKEDGCRYMGVMLHYLQDSGAFPHMQPLHRSCHVKNLKAIHLESYSPVILGETPDEACKTLGERVRQLTAWTERRFSPLFDSAGLKFEDAKRIAEKELMPSAVMDVVDRLKKEKFDEFESGTTDCANECVRACADAIYTILSFAKKPYVESSPVEVGKNIVFNPSFEKTEGDGMPEGWCVGWLDLADMKGRAEWYRAGTHWEKHVKTGQCSTMILWAPSKGLEWQQAWPKAIKVNPGEKYQGSVWVKASGKPQGNWITLEFSDMNYKPVYTAKSKPCSIESKWQQLSVEVAVPAESRWMRVLLHGESEDGAAWFDDVDVVRLP
ncbi:MAG: hypothetical protein A2283_15710 [Lentisphaerae bacterium RIFOXYA12_FULL_48_11]|nr:MAG: hypothetical protein A2283_15710 [Lentisphaerae bacterium RIFOXYA12_FULL_48_11]